MPLPPALAAKLAKRGILQQSDTNTSSKTTTKSAEGIQCFLLLFGFQLLKVYLTVRESEAKLAEETAALKEKEEKLLEIKLKVS